MPVTCQACGQSFETKRRNARYCSATCRQRGHRGAKPLEPAADATAEAVEPALVSATRVELGSRASSALGLAALHLAAAITSPLESGSGRASLAREFRATLAAALEGAQPAASPLDELRAKRDAKRGA